MGNGGSQLHSIEASEWIAANRSAFAVADPDPIVEGHSLIVPRRIIDSWWEAAPAEQADLLDLVGVVKEILEPRFGRDGYTIGIDTDITSRGDQPLHLHVVPAIHDPRSEQIVGIRAALVGSTLLSEATDRWSGHAIGLVGGPNAPMQAQIVDCLQDRAFDRVDLLVSFVMLSGLDLIGGAIEDALDRGAQLRVLATDYLGVTEPAALGWLLDRSTAGEGTTAPGQLDVKLFSDPLTSFHPKAYLFWTTGRDDGVGFVGSSNMSRSGLLNGIEWNLRTVDMPLLRAGFDALWTDVRAQELTEEWLARYRPHRRASRPAAQTDSGAEPSIGDVADDLPESAVDSDEYVAPAPTEIQAEALDALVATRADGHDSGLAIMATGLGKTWLAAFDSTRPAYRRVLFIAHREEILRQARDVFRRVRPDVTVGLFTGDERTTHTDVVFASIQSLVRNLDQFERHAFDYVVVDEFHHAAASSYRKALDHFVPQFLLGLTATPERMDGADLLVLCGDNLVFKCGLTESIDRNQLVPFHYFGVPDVVDFAPIPWRNGRFDPDSLENAIVTQERAEHAIREWSSRRGRRTLAFCASMSHADHMAEQLRRHDVAAVAVHSGPTSAPRRQAIDQLTAGEIEVVCSVDVFNEGLDVPAVDTVLMLRPTASPIVFLQQLGRGLRRDEGKDHLRVIDFIGNHRSFLAKPRVLLSLGGHREATADDAIDAVEAGSFQLPAGCRVEYELEAIDLFRQLRPLATARDDLTTYCRSFSDEHGVRPTIGQAWRSGFDPTTTRKQGGWFAFLDRIGHLGDAERELVHRYAGFLAEVEQTPITKSFKLVTLRSLIHEGGVRRGATVDAIAAEAHRMIVADRRLIADAATKRIPSPADADEGTWRSYWRRNPIAAWIGETAHLGSPWFRLEDDLFQPTFEVREADEDLLAALIAELVEYRLARYLEERRPSAESDDRAMVCRVSHDKGRPFITLDRRANPAMPVGTVPFHAAGAVYEGDFRKDALAVARAQGSTANDLHALLRGWFGPSAGLPGTNHRVSLCLSERGLELARVAVDEAPDTERPLPLFPTYDIACGAFDEPSRAIHEATTIDLRVGGDFDRDEHFVAFARGGSMDGGADPIKHGDPLIFEWARSVDRRDLVGERVLVHQHRTEGESAVVKRLDHVDGRYVLRSDDGATSEIPGRSDLTIVARLVRRLDQREMNPIADHIGEAHSRRSIAGLHGDPQMTTNWQQGHVTLPGQAILLVTLNKQGMAGGSEYQDHFEDVETFVWSSQASTGPDNKRGRQVIEALETGVHLHLWARAKKADSGFRYLGLVLPVSHEGSKPMSVTFRLFTPLNDALRTYLSVD